MRVQDANRDMLSPAAALEGIPQRREFEERRHRRRSSSMDDLDLKTAGAFVGLDELLIPRNCICGIVSFIIVTVVTIVLLLKERSVPSPPLPSGRVVRVKTPLGVVRGFTNGRSNLFLGIPYGQAPIEGRRWGAPQTVAAWDGTELDATFQGPACPQLGGFGYNITEQDEDCLFVNIYSPIGASLAYPIDALNSEAAPTAQRQRSAAALAPLLPVTVFFHGGGYVAGSGTQPLYNGSAFCNTSNTVLVTVNYRLGVMGFLSLPGLAKGGSSGNYGLLDQQAALKFVATVIKAFGGDASRVTLWGQGAGAESALLQVGLQNSRGLFNRVISESAVLSSLTIRSSQAMTNTSLTVAAAVGCLPRDGPQSAEHVDIDCMQHTSTRRLLEAAHTVGHQERWRPSVDGVHLKNSDPLAALRSSGASQSLDSVLLGANANDASSLLYFAWTPEERDNVTAARAQQLLRQYMPQGDTAERVWHEYAGRFSTGGGNFAQFAQIMTDWTFTCTQRHIAAALANNGIATYVFDYNQHLSFTPPALQAGHFMELALLWDKPCFVSCDNAEGSFTAAEVQLGGDMRELWASFATHGSPTGGGIGDAWPLFKPQSSVVGMDHGNSSSSGLVAAEQFVVLRAPALVTESFVNGVCDFWDTVTVPPPPGIELP